MKGRLESLKQWWREAQLRWGWIDHLLRSWTAYKTHHGDHFAAAVTFFSFLSLFPLILLAVSIAGFVLGAHPALQQELFDSIAKNVPGAFGDTLKESIDSAINARTSVGLIGLGGLLFTGLGWVANLRAAIEGVWGQEPAKRSFVTAKLADLTVLIGLGLAAILSIGVTAVGSTLTSAVLDALDLQDVPGLFVLTKVIGIGLALVGDVLIFWWVLVRLPRASVRPAVGLRAAILASVGFEILKLGGTFFITRATQSVTAGIFASVIGILVWLNLVSRFLLFCAAWTATASGTAPQAADTPPPVDEQEIAVALAREHDVEKRTPPGVPPAATAAVLVGAGAALGAGATLGASRWAAGSRRRRGRR